MLQHLCSIKIDCLNQEISHKQVIDFTKHNAVLLLYRLEEMKHQLDLLVEFVASIQKRELLYRTAFIRRSKNLQKAETEVFSCNFIFIHHIFFSG